MSCILQISGSTLDVDALLNSCPLAPDCVWRVGDPRDLRRQLHTTSGATFLVSAADFDSFNLQVEEATQFLNENQPEIANALSFPGIETKSLRFGITMRHQMGPQIDELPVEFIRAAANAGISVLLCHYPCSSEE